MNFFFFVEKNSLWLTLTFFADFCISSCFLEIKLFWHEKGQKTVEMKNLRKKNKMYIYVFCIFHLLGNKKSRNHEKKIIFFAHF